MSTLTGTAHNSAPLAGALPALTVKVEKDLEVLVERFLARKRDDLERARAALGRLVGERIAAEERDREERGRRVAREFAPGDVGPDEREQLLYALHRLLGFLGDSAHGFAEGLSRRTLQDGAAVRETISRTPSVSPRARAGSPMRSWTCG